MDPSGRRDIFVTFEGGSGLVGPAFFDSSREACAHATFHCGLLLAGGMVEARGPRCTVVGDRVWDFDVARLPAASTAREPPSTSSARSP
ncbi:hypothetical protein [Streptomyces sp. NBC_00388]|uniref:hypothetical protein n=1 Tax=Streptomyces sp. NBC_00388 TaxID=2975735 RepID=UPI002E24CD3C